MHLTQLWELTPNDSVNVLKTHSSTKSIYCSRRETIRHVFWVYSKLLEMGNLTTQKLSLNCVKFSMIVSVANQQTTATWYSLHSELPQFHDPHVLKRRLNWSAIRHSHLSARWTITSPPSVRTFLYHTIPRWLDMLRALVAKSDDALMNPLLQIFAAGTSQSQLWYEDDILRNVLPGTSH